MTGSGPAPGTDPAGYWTILLLAASAIGGVVAIVAGIMMAAAAPSAEPLAVAASATS